MSKLNDSLAAIVADLTASVVERAGQPLTWSPPWNRLATVPRNATTGVPYRGGNIILLWASQLVHTYERPLWATYKQWAAFGGQVRRGEHGTACVHWSPVEREDGTTRLIPTTFTVFNIDQQHGAQVVAPGPQWQDRGSLAAWNTFLEPIPVRTVAGEPAYSPARDLVMMPSAADFTSTDHYITTYAHELVHWTGHIDRCARDLKGRFGDQAYAAEELVAEIGAAFIGSRFGAYAAARDDHSEYLRSWLRSLQDDPTRLLTAAQHAQRAVDHLDSYHTKETAP